MSIGAYIEFFHLLGSHHHFRYLGFSARRGHCGFWEFVGHTDRSCKGGGLYITYGGMISSCQWVAAYWALVGRVGGLARGESLIWIWKEGRRWLWMGGDAVLRWMLNVEWNGYLYQYRFIFTCLAFSVSDRWGLAGLLE